MTQYISLLNPVSSLRIIIEFFRIDRIRKEALREDDGEKALLYIKRSNELQPKALIAYFYVVVVICGLVYGGLTSFAILTH